MIKDLLLHLLTILLPILVMQVLLLRTDSFTITLKQQLLVGLAGGVSAVLCMSFPVRFEEGFLWDFRWVPLTIATLYGGFPAGLVGIGISIAYRTALGGPAVYFALAGNTVAAIVPLLLAASFYKRTRVVRYVTALGVSLLCFAHALAAAAIYLLYIDRLYMPPEYRNFFIISCLLQLTLTFIGVFIVENGIETIRLRAGIARTEKLVVVSELAASIAHEIRNPLTVVRGFIQLAQASMERKMQAYMDTAIEELDRADSIISDYLSLAKPDAERMESVDLKDKLANIALILQGFAAIRGVSLHTDIKQDLRFRGDTVKLGQVVLNVMKNAVEAVQGEGDVWLTAFRRRNDIVIRIEDNGEGMTEEQLKRLGNSFVTTKENGTGLGLVAAFRIVEAMAGTLEYESRRGRGTIATITLPADEI